MVFSFIYMLFDWLQCPEREPGTLWITSFSWMRFNPLKPSVLNLVQVFCDFE